MPKYLIKWNAGYGENYKAGEYDTHKQAEEAAYEEWRDEAENNADYSAEILTKTIADDYGIDFEGEEDEM